MTAFCGCVTAERGVPRALAHWTDLF